MLPELTNQVVEGLPLEPMLCEQALEHIFTDERCDDLTIASFLTAMAARGTSATELSGFARTMRKHVRGADFNRAPLIDTAGTGGGVSTFNISTTAAFIIAGRGLSVAKHGNRAMTSRCGSADLLEALGVRLVSGQEQAVHCMDQAGFAFLFAQHHHPAMKRVAAVRRQLRHRTIFNLLGPLTNPASADVQVLGAYSRHAARLLAETLSLLGGSRAWVVHSDDGMDELSPFALSTVFSVEDGTVSRQRFDPGEFISVSGAIEDIAGGGPTENASIAKRVLSGEEVPDAARNAVLLNAAAAIHLAEGVTFSQAMDAAVEVLESGAANQALNALVEASNA